MKQFLKKYGAYLAAALIFLAAGWIYCYPSLQGKVINAGDNINGLSAVQENVNFTKETGEYSFWTGSMFSGMPNYQIGGGRYQGDRLLAPIKDFFQRGPAHPAWIIIFYLMSFFILLRSFGVDKWLSIVGAFAVALSSYFLVIIAAGHGGKTIAISYISLVAAGFYLIFHKKYGLGAVFTMFFTAIGFSIHPQMAYYLFMMIGVFFVAEVVEHIKEKRWKDLGIATVIFAAAVLIGLGTGCSNIFSNKEYAEQTMRGGHSDLVKTDEAQSGDKSGGLDFDYATQWSYGIDESMTFMIPGFMGGSSNYILSTSSATYKALQKNGVAPKSCKDFIQNVPLYWGDQPFTAGNVYMGAIVCFLFILGLFLVKGPYKWALLISTLFSVALAWGHNFAGLSHLFFNWFPLYNKFRAVSSILIVAEVAMPLLGFLAVKQLMDEGLDKKKALKSIGISAAITAGLCLIFAIFGKAMFSFTSIYDGSFVSQIPDWLYKAIIEDRAALLVSDSWRSFLFIAAAAAVLALFAAGKLKSKWMIPVLGILIVADMWPVDKRYFGDRDFVSQRQEKSVFEKMPYEELILQDPDPHFRVFNLATNTFNEARTSYYLKSIGGYSAAKLRRYQDLIDVYLSKADVPVASMLNAKYIIGMDGNGQVIPQYNPYAQGNAWFVDKIEIAEDANEEIEALGAIDLEKTAVTDRSFASFVQELSHDDEAEVELTSYSPKELNYTAKCSQPGTIVFSEIYYPYGWKAYVDGILTEHFRANYTLRAINVPQGEHQIRFIFDPDSVRKGDTISVICVLLMYALTLGIIIAAALPRFRRKNG